VYINGIMSQWVSVAMFVRVHQCCELTKHTFLEHSQQENSIMDDTHIKLCSKLNPRIRTSTILGGQETNGKTPMSWILLLLCRQ
ncbi:hypothetical protein L9F63_000345, partial [Diploptera punctata]